MLISYKLVRPTHLTSVLDSSGFRYVAGNCGREKTAECSLLKIAYHSETSINTTVKAEVVALRNKEHNSSTSLYGHCDCYHNNTPCFSSDVLRVTTHHPTVSNNCTPVRTNGAEVFASHTQPKARRPPSSCRGTWLPAINCKWIWSTHGSSAAETAERHIATRQTARMSISQHYLSKKLNLL